MEQLDSHDHDELKSEPEFELAKSWALHTNTNVGTRSAVTNKWTMGPKPSFVREFLKKCSINLIKTCETLFDEPWMAECRKFADISTIIKVSFFLETFFDSVNKRIILEL